MSAYVRLRRLAERISPHLCSSHAEVLILSIVSSTPKSAVRTTTWFSRNILISDCVDGALLRSWRHGPFVPFTASYINGDKTQISSVLATLKSVECGGGR